MPFCWIKVISTWHKHSINRVSLVWKKWGVLFNYILAFKVLLKPIWIFQNCYISSCLIKHKVLNIIWYSLKFYFIFFPFIFISWRIITLQYCSGFCHTLTWISHGFTCVPHPDPPSRLPPHPIPLGLPSAPALSTCLIHPTWAGDLDSILVSMLFSQNIPPSPPSLKF